MKPENIVQPRQAGQDANDYRQYFADLLRTHSVVSLVAGGLLLAGGAALATPASGPVAVSPGSVQEAMPIGEVCPTFSWTEVESAGGYELVVWRLSAGAEESAEFETAIAEKLPGGALGWTPSLGRCLARGGRYAWAVRAIGGDGVGEWSDPALFIVAAGPTEAVFQEALAIVRRYLAASGAAAASRGREAGEDLSEAPAAPERGRRPAIGVVSARGADGKALATAPAAIHAEPSATSGEVVGVRGVVNSSGGAAGVFNNTAGGKILSGLNDGSEVLNVNGSGDVSATSFSGDGSGLTGLNPANITGTVAITKGGTGATTAATARANLGAAGNFSELSGTLESGQLTGTYSSAVTLSNASNSFTGDGSGLTGVTSTDPTKVAKSGDTMTGTLTLTPGAGDALVANADIDLASGDLYKGGVLFLHDNGSSNTALGDSALLSGGGAANTAIGEDAMRLRSSGSRNTAIGGNALKNNTSGSDNTAVGDNANASGNGSDNTAVGEEALRVAGGTGNTAVGEDALYSNSTGDDNTAIGRRALRLSTGGQDNTAVGWGALIDSTGNDNIAVGKDAGSVITTGNGNIYLGHPGVAGDSGFLRIGFPLSRAYINGIRGITTNSANAIPVLIDSSGQLGTTSSSRRFKKDIRNMGEVSSRVLELRPVSFRYKQHLSAEASTGDRRTVQYGLIAEEVKEIFPELVVYDSEGHPETVRYHLLSSLLLNELQKQQRTIGKLAAEVERLRGE